MIAPHKIGLRGVFLLSVSLVIVIAASTLTAQDIATDGLSITTSKGIRTLPPLKGLNENGIRQADRIAEITLGELALDESTLDKEETSLLKEVAAYEQRKDDEQALLDDPKGAFKVGENEYLRGLDLYKERSVPHDADAANQHAEAKASNSLPPEQRNAANVSRLNAWKEKIDARKILLDQERDILIEKRRVLDAIVAAADARLKAIRDPLQLKIAALAAKQGLAYRQLKQCHLYAVEIRKILKEKYTASAPYSPAFDSAIERLKALSARGWDLP